VALLGLAATVAAVWIDYRWIGELHHFIYWANVGLLLLLFVFGRTVNGNLNWISIAGIGFQPAEIAKVAVVVSLAKRLSLYEKPIDTYRELGKELLYVAIPLVLILVQKDLGTSMVYIFFVVVMLFAAKTKMKLLGTLGGIGLISIVPTWLFFLTNNQKARVIALINPESLDPDQIRQLVNGKTAVGAGRIWGMGFFNPGSYSQLNYIPEQRTDFIFAVLAETLGLVGCTVLLVLYAVLVFRMLRAARLAADKFGSYLVIGLMAMLLFHVFENIGMVIGIMPMTGIPLPFLSYGGTALVANMIAVGLALNVGARRNRESIFAKHKTLEIGT